jgi:hypothetical protein
MYSFCKSSCIGIGSSYCIPPTVEPPQEAISACIADCIGLITSNSVYIDGSVFGGKDHQFSFYLQYINFSTISK